MVVSAKTTAQAVQAITPYLDAESRGHLLMCRGDLLLHQFDGDVVEPLMPYFSRHCAVYTLGVPGETLPEPPEMVDIAVLMQV